MQNAKQKINTVASLCASAILFTQAATGMGLMSPSIANAEEGMKNKKAIEDSIDTPYAKVYVDRLAIANDGSHEVDMAGSLEMKEDGTVLDYKAGGTLQTDAHGALRISPTDHFVQLSYKQDDVFTQVTMTKLNNVIVQTIVLKLPEQSPEQKFVAQVNVINTTTREKLRFDCNASTNEIKDCHLTKTGVDYSVDESASASVRDLSVVKKLSIYKEAILNRAMRSSMPPSLAKTIDHNKSTIDSQALQIHTYVNMGIPPAVLGGAKNATTQYAVCKPH